MLYYILLKYLTLYYIIYPYTSQHPDHKCRSIMGEAVVIDVGLAELFPPSEADSFSHRAHHLRKVEWAVRAGSVLQQGGMEHRDLFTRTSFRGHELVAFAGEPAARV